MQDVDELLDGDQDDNLTRRDVLGILTGGVTAATAGCVGGNSETPESSETSTNTATPEEVTSTQTDTQAQTPSETPTQTDTQTPSETPTSTDKYPEQESENTLQAYYDEIISGREDMVAVKFKIDDLDVPQFSGLVEEYNEGKRGGSRVEDLSELAGKGIGISYDEMLYLAANMESAVGEVEDVYFGISKPEKGSGIVTVLNAKEAPVEGYSAGAGDYYVVGRTDDKDAIKEDQTNFLKDIGAEAEDVVHAIDLQDAPYIEEAL